MGLQVETLVVSDFMQNCRVIFDEVSREAIIFDPGGHGTKILDFLSKAQLKAQAIVVTHCHIDHVGALMEVKSQLGIPLFVHKLEKPLIEGLAEQGRMFGIQVEPIDQVEHWIEEGQKLDLIGHKIDVIHAPGHSPGSCCFLIPTPQPSVIVGDVLFAGSIGRTDLFGGDYATLISSIKEKLLVLPDETLVLSGHGPDTTIGEERQSNPFLQ